MPNQFLNSKHPQPQTSPLQKRERERLQKLQKKWYVSIKQKLNAQTIPKASKNFILTPFMKNLQATTKLQNPKTRSGQTKAGRATTRKPVTRNPHKTQYSYSTLILPIYPYLVLTVTVTFIGKTMLALITALIATP